MCRYYFHATDGYSFLLDPSGRRIESREVIEVAGEAADAVRRRCGSLADLTDWLVVVQNEMQEQVAVIPFAELPGSAATAHAPAPSGPL